MPRSFCFGALCILAPVPFHHFPVVSSVHPMVGNPALTRPRRVIPMATHPDIASAIPTLITIHPDISAIGRRGTTLDDWGRWSDADNNLRIRGRRQESKSEQRCHCKFFHDGCSPQRFGVPDSAVRSGLLIVSTRSGGISCASTPGHSSPPHKPFDAHSLRRVVSTLSD